MSVLIKDMELPKNCSECPVALCGKYCRINQTHTTYRELPIRPDHCPLVELPEHHGRLIDADALVAESLADGAYGYVGTKEIYDAPTIVEAEGVNQ